MLINMKDPSLANFDSPKTDNSSYFKAETACYVYGYKTHTIAL